MSEKLLQLATQLARARTASAEIAGEVEELKAELENSETYKKFIEAKEQLKTARAEEDNTRSVLVDGMLSDHTKTGNKSFSFGKITRKTIIDFIDEGATLAWAIDRQLDTLLTLNKSEVKKIARTLDPDGVEVSEGVQARINGDLNHLLD